MRRTLEAAQAAGIKIDCLEVTKDGTIRIVPKDADNPPEDRPNSFDQVLA
jgi:hypothetical protein